MCYRQIELPVIDDLHSWQSFVLTMKSMRETGYDDTAGPECTDDKNATRREPKSPETMRFDVISRWWYALRGTVGAFIGGFVLDFSSAYRRGEAEWESYAKFQKSNEAGTNQENTRAIDWCRCCRAANEFHEHATEWEKEVAWKCSTTRRNNEVRWMEIFIGLYPTIFPRCFDETSPGPEDDCFLFLSPLLSNHERWNSEVEFWAKISQRSEPPAA